MQLTFVSCGVALASLCEGICVSKGLEHMQQNAKCVEVASVLYHATSNDRYLYIALLISVSYPANMLGNLNSDSHL